MTPAHDSPPAGPAPLPSWQLASWHHAARTMTEDGLMAEVRALAARHGWLIYHTHDSRRSDRGWPDLAMASSAQGRLLLVELKSPTGRPSPQQVIWLRTLHACGQETALWRPADLPVIQQILAGARITDTFGSNIP